MSDIDRFKSKIEITDQCHLWSAYIDPNGYGRFHYRGKAVLAHKWWWEYHHGQVPDGLELDHLCRTKNCVNPEHLETVTHQVNNQRAYGNTCKRGHTGDWYVQPDGRRRCRACIREYDKTYERKNPERDRANARERQRRYQQRKKAQ